MKKQAEASPSRAKSNRFAGRVRSQPVVVALAPDVSKVFKTAEAVNAALRSIVQALPPGAAD